MQLWLSDLEKVTSLLGAHAALVTVLGVLRGALNTEPGSRGTPGKSVRAALVWWVLAKCQELSEQRLLSLSGQLWDRVQIPILR